VASKGSISDNSCHNLLTIRASVSGKILFDPSPSHISREALQSLLDLRTGLSAVAGFGRPWVSQETS
jgi:hypothetical protein